MTKPYFEVRIDMLEISPSVAVRRAAVDSLNLWYVGTAIDESVAHDGYHGSLRMFPIQDWVTRGEVDQLLADNNAVHAHPWLLAAYVAQHRAKANPDPGELLKVTYALGLELPGESSGLNWLPNLWVKEWRPKLGDGVQTRPIGKFQTRLGLLEAGPNFEFRPGEWIIAIPA